MAKAFQKASWIWIPGEPKANQYADFAQTFALDSTDSPILIRISADSQYCLYLNGRYVFAGQYGDLPSYKVYDELDVTEFVHTGDNVIEVFAYCTLTDSSVYRRGDPGVIYELTREGKPIVYSGAETLCAQSSRYRSGPIDLISGQLGYSFDFDATQPPPLMGAPLIKSGAAAYHLRPVKRPELKDRKPGLLKAQGAYFLPEGEHSLGARMQYAALAHRDLETMTGLAHAPAALPTEQGIPLSVREGDGIYLLVDLLMEDAGFLDIDLWVENETEILIGWGEHADDLRLRTYIGGRNFAARYFAKPGRQRFFHPFKRAGLRYVELFIASREARVFYAGIMPTVYPTRHGAEFHTADALHSRIHEVSVRTLITCMHEHYEDCPWREQALYAMDSRNQMLAGYYALGEYAMPRASLKLLAHSLRSDGLLELCAPARVEITIPSFTAMFVVALYEYALFSADFCFAQELLPTALSIADSFCARRAANGLIPAYRETEYWNFYEWREGLDGQQIFRNEPLPERYDAPLNCFVALALDRLARLLSLMDKRQKAAYYYDFAAQLKHDIHCNFWNKKDGLYDTYLEANARTGRHELTQALCVYAGACPDSHLNGTLSRLTDGTLTPVTLSHTIFKYDALMRKPAEYSRWVFDDVARQWGAMLYSGATTFWETQEGGWDFSNAGSLCHGWSAVPAYLYFAYALGVKPETPGFAAYTVEPVNSGLYELSGTIITRDGREIELGSQNAQPIQPTDQSLRSGSGARTIDNGHSN